MLIAQLRGSTLTSIRGAGSDATDSDGRGARLDEGKTTSSGAAMQATHRFGYPRRPFAGGLVAKDVQKPDNGVRRCWNPVNVG